MVDFVALPQAGQTYVRNVVFVTSWHSFVSSFVVSGKSVAMVAFFSLARTFSAIASHVSRRIWRRRSFLRKGCRRCEVDRHFFPGC